MRPALLLSCALLLPACARELVESDSWVEPDRSGSVRVPLTTTSEDGVSYALRGATVELAGAALLTLSASPGDERLSAPLPPGVYTSFLRPDFELVELDAEGIAHPVEARLVSQNPKRFHLAEFEDSTLRLVFERAGKSIVFGPAAAFRITSAR